MAPCFSFPPAAAASTTATARLVAPAATTRPRAAAASTSAADGSSGLTQGQVGGILGGIVGGILLVTVIWMLLTHSRGYLSYYSIHPLGFKRDRYTRAWPRARPVPPMYYDYAGAAAYGYDAPQEGAADDNSSDSSDSSTADAQPGRNADAGDAPQPEGADAAAEGAGQTFYQQPEMTAEQLAEYWAAYMYAAEQMQHSRRPPKVAVRGDYVLNPPPPRFPPTVRRTNHRRRHDPSPQA